MKVIVKVKKKQNNAEPLYINTEYITLDAAMKLSSIVGSGGQAKLLIKDGLVKVNGENCEVLRKKLYDGDKFSFENKEFEIRKNINEG